MTTAMEKVVGCSNRFRIRLMLALPMPFIPVVTKKASRRLRSKLFIYFCQSFSVENLGLNYGLLKKEKSYIWNGRGADSETENVSARNR